VASNKQVFALTTHCIFFTKTVATSRNEKINREKSLIGIPIICHPMHLKWIAEVAAVIRTKSKDRLYYEYSESYFRYGIFSCRYAPTIKQNAD